MLKDFTKERACSLNAIACALVMTLWPLACSSIDYDAASAPRMLVSEDKTPFFKNGPAQGNGPDRTLQAGEDVTVMCRESGYSRVQLPTGEIGYVANEALVAAPPPIKATNVPVGNVPSLPDQQPSFRY